VHAFRQLRLAGWPQSVCDRLTSLTPDLRQGQGFAGMRQAVWHGSMLRPLHDDMAVIATSVHDAQSRLGQLVGAAARA
jgi:hypothetical protein